MITNFMQEILADPIGSRSDIALIQLADQYHELCEAYDRKICTGPIVKDGIMPNTDEERILINKNAKEVRTRLGAEATCLGFTTQQWREAISETGRRFR